MADHRLQIILAAKDISGTALAKFRSSVTGITKSVFSLNTMVGTLAGTTGLGLLVTKSLAAADAIGKTADKLSLHTGALQEYQYAANQSGVNTETLNMALQRFTRRTAEAAQGKGELKDVLQQYNIAVKDAAGNTRRTEDVLDDLADVMQRTDSGAERLRIAFKAFDSEGAALVNMLRNGSAGLDAFRDKARRLGLVIDDDLIKNSSKAKDELDTLGRVLKTQVTSTVVELAPKITEVSADILKWVENNQKLIQQDIPGYLSDIATALGKIAKYSKLRSVMGTFTEGADLAAKGLIDWNTFIGASFTERQRMVDEALALTNQAMDAHVEAYKKYMGALNKAGGGSDKGGGGGPGTSSGSLPKMQKAAFDMARYKFSASESYRIGVPDIYKTGKEQMQEAYEQGQALGAAAGPDSWLVKAEKQFQSVEDTAKSVTVNISNHFENMAARSADALSNFVTEGKFSLKDLLGSIASDLVRMQSSAALNTIFSGMLTANAKGNIYGATGLQRFAKGAVVDKPTVFPFSRGVGLMGEDGPEGILPLKRMSSGNLGVMAEGGGQVKVDISLKNETSTQIEMSKTQRWVSPNRMVADIVLSEKITSRSFRQGMRR